MRERPGMEREPPPSPGGDPRLEYKIRLGPAPHPYLFPLREGRWAGGHTGLDIQWMGRGERIGERCHFLFMITYIPRCLSARLRAVAVLLPSQKKAGGQDSQRKCLRGQLYRDIPQFSDGQHHRENEGSSQLTRPHAPAAHHLAQLPGNHDLPDDNPLPNRRTRPSSWWR